MAKSINFLSGNKSIIFGSFDKSSFKNINIKKIILVQALTFWNAWYWYVSRMLDGSDEPLGILALITLIFFIGKVDLNKLVTKNQVNIFIIILLTYILTYRITPDMIHSIFAVISLGYTFYISKEKISPAIIGLFFMTLPVIASMQFYLGYPLRSLNSYMMVILLRLNGFYVSQDGTCLNFNKNLICVDAPCSGINMLWFSSYFALFICCLYKLNLHKTIKVSLISFISIIIANIMRSTSLFYTESGVLKLPAFVHQGVGILTFILSISIVIIYVNMSERKCRT